MKTANRLLPRVCLFFGLVLFLTPPAAPRARAHGFPQQQTQDDDDASTVEERPFVDLMLEVDCDRCAKVTFEYPLALREKYNFSTVLSNVLGSPLTDVNLSPSDYDQSELLSARCVLPLRRYQFVETGNIDLQPFKDIQKAEPNIPFVVTLLITRQDFLRCDPEPEHLFRTSKSTTCLYSLNNARNSPAILRPEFGYSRAQVLRLTGILGSLLFMPIALTFWSPGGP
jgi:hypothetical protein